MEVFIGLLLFINIRFKASRSTSFQCIYCVQIEIYSLNSIIDCGTEMITYLPTLISQLLTFTYLIFQQNFQCKAIQYFFFLNEEIKMYFSKELKQERKIIHQA